MFSCPYNVVLISASSIASLEDCYEREETAKYLHQVAKNKDFSVLIFIILFLHIWRISRQDICKKAEICPACTASILLDFRGHRPMRKYPVWLVERLVLPCLSNMLDNSIVENLVPSSREV